MAIPINARELFKTAYTSRYTWDENFPGYTADVELKQADAVYTGKIRINRDLIVEVTGIADKQVQGGIITQLTDLTIACQRINFEESYSKHEFICGETDTTDAVEILVKGDSMESKYQIRDREIFQISRTVGNTSAVFAYLQNLDTGEGYIRDRYDAIFRNVQTNEIIEHIKFTDSYDKVGRYYIMTHQVVQESPMTSTTEFKYLNIKLCEPVKV
jgi:CRISPR/Cas system CSM-associated protein Csm5 (group 7 of RAMP superfamily)